MGTKDILIADNQFLTSEALQLLIREKYGDYTIRLACTQTDLKGALELFDIRLLIIDYFMFDFETYEELSNLIVNHPSLTILIVSNTIDKASFTEFTKLGIKNILLKNTDATDFYTAIDYALKGKKYYSSEIIDNLMDTGHKSLPVEKNTLTASEKEIVKLIADGLTTKQIAERKCVSFHTVNTHRKNIFRKMNVSNTSELIMQAIKSGLIDSIEYYI